MPLACQNFRPIPHQTLMPSSFFALFDDIASLLDDISAMTKIAAGKTAGVVGDDLAVNAEQVSGSAADRELPVVWAVAKGSLVNKAILVPTAMGISLLEVWLHGRGFAVPLILSLLTLGGCYLCYEGVEKLAHAAVKRHRRRNGTTVVEDIEELPDDLSAFEREKIKGAIRTDFVLSAEIIVIALGTVAEAPFAKQVAVLSAVAVAMTVGVYGFVAAIVKLDDLGLLLASRPGAGGPVRAQRALGRAVLAGAPWLMKGLTVAGTAAMFLVGGGILAHGIPGLEAAVHAVAGEGRAAGLLALLADAVVGLVAGGVAVAVARVVSRVRSG